MDTKPYTAKNPIIRVFNAFTYSMKGMQAAFKSEAAFRQDIILAIINIGFAFTVPDKYFCIWMVFSSLFLLFAELVNTAIEYIVDRISLERHPLAGSAKDIGSALVFIAILNITFSWLIYWLK